MPFDHFADRYVFERTELFVFAIQERLDPLPSMLQEMRAHEQRPGAKAWKTAGSVAMHAVTAEVNLILEKTYNAVPPPQRIIAKRACAISGGLFRDHPESGCGAANILPVDGSSPAVRQALDTPARLVAMMPGRYNRESSSGRQIET